MHSRETKDIVFLDVASYLPYRLSDVLIYGSLGLKILAKMNDLDFDTPFIDQVHSGLETIMTYAMLMHSCFGVAEMIQEVRSSQIWDINDVPFRDERTKHEFLNKNQLRSDVKKLIRAINEEYSETDLSLDELNDQVGDAIERYLFKRTGEKIGFSHKIKQGNQIFYDYLGIIGLTNIIDRDITLFKVNKHFSPFVSAHEFCHRIGYFRELDANAIAYQALIESGNPVLRQSARLMRLDYTLDLLLHDSKDSKIDTARRFGLKKELCPDMEFYDDNRTGLAKLGYKSFISAYGLMMKLTKQNGIGGYSLGFINYLHLAKIKI
ncbi:MAG: DUF3810 family protein [Candidatus Woesearchaeota archaeon]|nr:DUF3810 family protein [Candidatus Woesearchaeota archaeon]